jgi:hypothetical protein
MSKNHLVAHSVDNQEKNRCIDIIQDLNGKFRFQEWRREPEDISGWFLVLDSSPKTYPTVMEAIAAAKQTIAWLHTLNQSPSTF